ncbi:MAG: type II toxin-antitoxin system RelE/ParE family toxin [Gammaproteobacteria bacterium]|nr:type II toxin-antitoxin system RelE/ParE family toxin [Gammaproteobacteria bacterium]
MTKAIFSPLACTDLKEIKAFIAGDNRQAAVACIALLKKRCDQLASSPKIGVADERYLGLRKFPVGNYIIFYREQENGVDIVRILHSARDVENIISQ